MTVAHTERTGSPDVFENHGEEFRSCIYSQFRVMRDRSGGIWFGPRGAGIRRLTGRQEIRVGEFGLNPCSPSQPLFLLLGTPVLLVAFKWAMH